MAAVPRIFLGATSVALAILVRREEKALAIHSPSHVEDVHMASSADGEHFAAASVFIQGGRHRAMEQGVKERGSSLTAPGLTPDVDEEPAVALLQFGFENVALNKPASASSVLPRDWMTPQLANDGKTNYRWGGRSVFHSRSQSREQWWKVDLGETYTIHEIIVYNRQDAGQARIIGFHLTIRNAGSDAWKYVDPNSAWKNVYDIIPPTPVAGDAVKLSLPSKAKNVLNFAEMRVLAAPPTPPPTTPPPTTPPPTTPPPTTPPPTTPPPTTPPPTGPLTNVALNKAAFASSKSGQSYMDPKLANDGSANYQWGGNSVFMTATWDNSEQWWKVDLGETYKIHDIIIYNRQDAGQARIIGFHLTIRSGGGVSDVWHYVDNQGAKNVYEIHVGGVAGDEVKLTLPPKPDNVLNFAEMQVLAETPPIPTTTTTTTPDAGTSHPAQWMSGKWGVGFRVQGGNNSIVEQFQTERILEQIKTVAAPGAGPGLSYVLFGLSSGADGETYIAPHPVLERIGNVRATPTRDLFMELATMFKHHGYKVIAYMATEGPAKLKHGPEMSISWDDTTQTAPYIDNWKAEVRTVYGSDDEDTLKNAYADIIVKTYADRYGSLIDGWWFDHAERGNISRLRDVCKAGNPKTIVAFSKGSLPCTKPNNPPDFEDYIFGHPVSYRVGPPNCTENLAQIEAVENTADTSHPGFMEATSTLSGKTFRSLGHVFQHACEGWNNGPLLFPVEQAIDWSTRVLNSKGAITWNLPLFNSRFQLRDDAFAWLRSIAQSPLTASSH